MKECTDVLKKVVILIIKKKKKNIYKHILLHIFTWIVRYYLYAYNIIIIIIKFSLIMLIIFKIHSNIS